jgi:hypothetical protein
MNIAIVGPIPDDQYSPDMFYLVESEGELLFVTSERVYNGQLVVYWVDTKNRVLEPVISIGSRAPFLGRNRCSSVDSSKVPTVQAGSIYYADNSLVRRWSIAESPSTLNCKWCLLMVKTVTPTMTSTMPMPRSDV